MKPLSQRAYGSIAHLPGSRLGPGDHHITEGQARIATEKTRDKHDIVIVQEKLDGSNVAVAKLNGQLLALTRRGYLATSSPYKQHHYFAAYVQECKKRFDELLNEGERICGEWMAMAHGTRYDFTDGLHDPFIPFDIFDQANKRLPYEAFKLLTEHFDLTIPKVISIGRDSCSIEYALRQLGEYGFHKALDKVEGAVWRVERKGQVDFLCKYVRPDKQDGCFFEDNDKGLPCHWNYDCSRWDNGTINLQL